MLLLIQLCVCVCVCVGVVEERRHERMKRLPLPSNPQSVVSGTGAIMPAVLSHAPVTLPQLSIET